MDPKELFRANLSLVDRVIDRVCRRARVYGADAEDFASSVKLALIEDDYAILRKYEGRSSLATFLTVVIQRLLADERMRTLGRWHPSSEARRIGEAAVLLETLTRRDGRSLDEAMPFVRAVDPNLTRDQMLLIANRLPDRVARPRAIDIDAADPEVFIARESDGAEAGLVAADTRRLSDHTARIVRDTLASLPLEDRMLVRFRFGSSMSIADISRMMRLPQRPLYRRLEALLQKLRKALTEAGIDGGSVSELIGSTTLEMDFGLDERENGTARQSNEDVGPDEARERT